MESATFRTWLADRGCRFDQHESEKGHGHAAVTVHREGRTAELPLVGTRQSINLNTARAICQALDLEWTELPGSMSRV
jgi:hypothetical protein